MKAGYIYILTHKRIPGLVKIGFTTTTVEQRLAEINSATGVPGKYQVIYSREITNPRSVEGMIHAKLHPFRHVANKEFFELKPEVAKNYVDKIIDNEDFDIKIELPSDRSKYVFSFLDSKELGSIIRFHRKKQGLRQDELAGVTNVGVRFIVDLEAGKPTIQMEKALKVLHMLGLKLGLTQAPE